MLQKVFETQLQVGDPLPEALKGLTESWLGSGWHLGRDSARSRSNRMAHLSGHGGINESHIGAGGQTFDCGSALTFSLDRDFLRLEGSTMLHIHDAFAF